MEGPYPWGRYLFTGLQPTKPAKLVGNALDRTAVFDEYAISSIDGTDLFDVEGRRIGQLRREAIEAGVRLCHVYYATGGVAVRVDLVAGAWDDAYLGGGESQHRCPEDSDDPWLCWEYRLGFHRRHNVLAPVDVLVSPEPGVEPPESPDQPWLVGPLTMRRFLMTGNPYGDASALGGVVDDLCLGTTHRDTSFLADTDNARAFTTLLEEAAIRHHLWTRYIGQDYAWSVNRFRRARWSYIGVDGIDLLRDTFGVSELADVTWREFRKKTPTEDFIGLVSYLGQNLPPLRDDNSYIATAGQDQRPWKKRLFP